MTDISLVPVGRVVADGSRVTGGRRWRLGYGGQEDKDLNTDWLSWSKKLENNGVFLVDI